MISVRYYYLPHIINLQLIIFHLHICPIKRVELFLVFIYLLNLFFSPKSKKLEVRIINSELEILGHKLFDSHFKTVFSPHVSRGDSYNLSTS